MASHMLRFLIAASLAWSSKANRCLLQNVISGPGFAEDVLAAGLLPDPTSFVVEDFKIAVVEQPEQLGNPHGDKEGHAADDASDFVADDQDTGPDEFVKEVHREATAMALMLFGNVAFVTVVGYLLNSGYVGVRQSTWVIFHYSISIFVAVLIVAMFREVAEAIAFGPLLALSNEYHDHHEHHAPPGYPEVANAGFRLLVQFLIFERLLVTYRTKPLTCMAIGNIGSHVVGFSAIDAFGSLQQMSLFRTSLVYSCMATVLAIVVMRGACFVAQAMREPMEVESQKSRTSRVSWDGEKWKELCSECEDDFLGLTLGLMISLTLRFAILGHLPPIHGEPRHKAGDQVLYLFVAALSLGALTVLGSTIVRMYPRLIDEKSMPWLRRAVHITLQTFAMSSAWMFMSWGNWSFFFVTDDRGMSLGGRMTARMVVAMGFFFAFVISIHVFQVVAIRVGPREAAVRTNVLFWALLLGLSWKRVFKQALSSAGRQFEDPMAQIFIDTVLRAALCCLVIPCWVIYILPRASKQLSWVRRPDGFYEEELED